MTVEKPDGHVVSVHVAAPRSFAAVRARLPIGRVPTSFATYLNQVYAAARGGGIPLDGQNIFVYRRAEGDEVDVDFGVGVTERFTSTGTVTCAELPTGEVATTTHWGNYTGLGDAHGAVIAWCRAHKREITGTRWEIYGHWTDDPSQLRTDIFYLLGPP